MRIQLTVLIVLFLCSCASQPTTLPGATQTEPITERKTNTPPTPAMDTNAITLLAVADLATRLSLDPRLVRVVSVESQLWPDSSLGCPKPGVAYTQQTVPGYRLRLEANGQEYPYHTDTDDTVILCREDDLPSFPVTPGEIDDGQPWMPVD